MECSEYVPFNILADFLYWSLDSIWSAVVPKTAPKSYTHPLDFWIDDMYSGRLKRMSCRPHPWWPHLPPRPHKPHPWTLLLELYSLVILWHRVVVVSPSLPLIQTDGGAVYISIIMIFLYNKFWTNNIILVLCSTQPHTFVGN